jgi:hypothetical protein
LYADFALIMLLRNGVNALISYNNGSKCRIDNPKSATKKVTYKIESLKKVWLFYTIAKQVQTLDFFR